MLYYYYYYIETENIPFPPSDMECLAKFNRPGSECFSKTNIVFVYAICYIRVIYSAVYYEELRIFRFNDIRMPTVLDKTSMGITFN